MVEVEKVVIEVSTGRIVVSTIGNDVSVGIVDVLVKVVDLDMTS